MFNFQKSNLIKNAQRNWTDIFLKKIYRWSTVTWKGAQHHWSSGKCKSKPQWGTSLAVQWLRLCTSTVGDTDSIPGQGTKIPRTAQHGPPQKKDWWGYGEIGILVPHWCECKLVQPLWRTVWRFLKKLKIELSYDPAILLLGIYLKKTKTLIWKDTCTLMFTAALFIIAETWKQPKCPSIDK